MIKILLGNYQTSIYIEVRDWAVENNLKYGIDWYFDTTIAFGDLYIKDSEDVVAFKLKFGI